MDVQSTTSAQNPSIDDARLLVRGTARLVEQLGYLSLVEFSLPGGRRADLMALGRKGEIAIVEIKSGLADLRADNKWPDYLDYCDCFYFAVSERFPHDRLPQHVGLIIADGFGGAIIRESRLDKLPAARRKALTLRFARCAADRLGRA